MVKDEMASSSEENNSSDNEEVENDDEVENDEEADYDEEAENDEATEETESKSVEEENSENLAPEEEEKPETLSSKEEEKPEKKEEDKQENLKLKGDEKHETSILKDLPRHKELPEFDALIFMCNNTTMSDCFNYGVFGLPENKRHTVEQVRQGMRLFLYNIQMKLLYGVFRAACRGGYNLEAGAFRGYKKFPWQVRFVVYKECIPLHEHIFREAIKENYVDNKFKIELTGQQAQKLMKLFRPAPEGAGYLPSFPKPQPRIQAQNRSPERRQPVAPQQKRKPEGPAQYRSMRKSLVEVSELITKQEKLPPQDRSTQRAVVAVPEASTREAKSPLQGESPVRPHSSAHQTTLESEIQAQEKLLEEHQPTIPQITEDSSLLVTNPHVAHQTHLWTETTLPKAPTHARLWEMDSLLPIASSSDRRLEEYHSVLSQSLHPQDPFAVSNVQVNSRSWQVDRHLGYDRPSMALLDPALGASSLPAHSITPYRSDTLYRPDSELHKSDSYQIGARETRFPYQQRNSMAIPSMEAGSLYRLEPQPIPDTGGGMFNRPRYEPEPLGDVPSIVTGISSSMTGKRPYQDAFLGDHANRPLSRQFIQEDLSSTYQRRLPFEERVGVTGSLQYNGSSLPLSYSQYNGVPPPARPYGRGLW